MLVSSWLELAFLGDSGSVRRGLADARQALIWLVIRNRYSIGKPI